MTSLDLECRLCAIERQMAEIFTKLDRNHRETQKLSGFYPPDPIPFHLLLEVSAGQVGH